MWSREGLYIQNSMPFTYQAQVQALTVALDQVGDSDSQDLTSWETTEERHFEV